MRSLTLFAMMVLAFGSSICPAHAELISAPIAVQAQILVRILPYERGFAQNVNKDVTVVLVERADDSGSANAVQQMRKALQDIGDVRGHALQVRTLSYAGAAALASCLRSEGAHVVYIPPGLSQDIPAIAAALVSSRILSFAAVEAYVRDGLVLGVDVADGKPRMSINLRQARLQRIEFPAAILKLAKVYK